MKKTLRMKIMRKNLDLYLLITPVLVYITVFHYFPMIGVQIAFKDFNGVQGIWGSPWVGFEYFNQFFDSIFFWRIITNTIGISTYQLLVGFLPPILLALMLNELSNGKFKKLVQNVTYAPHFLSTVVLVGMLVVFLDPRTGIVNQLVVTITGEPIKFMTDTFWFKSLYVFSGVWQHTGWAAIIYIAALVGIDPQLHEAATVDGASRLQRIWHINIPGILPTAIILLILQFSTVMNVGFEKVFLMQNSMNMPASDVIQTYVYRNGILGAQYGFSAAIGLFNSLINFALLITVNWIARKKSETSLW